MFENINIRSSVPVYVQVENHVQFAVASGRLKPGDQLPSIRELSEKLSVNPNTIAKSYRTLEVMGIVYTRRGMGVFINRTMNPKCVEECRKRIVARLNEVVAEAKAAGMKAQEVKDICTKSYAHDADPYGDTPADVLALANVPSSGKK